MAKKILYIVLTSLIGFVFIVSAFTKGGFGNIMFPRYSSPIEPFEFTFVNIGVANWQTAPFIARILIGFEFFIGIILLFNLRFKKIGFKLATATLLIFSVYLILLMIFSGNKGNCGCFGEVFSMSPFWALVKNLGMIAVLYYLYRNHHGLENKIATIFIVISLVVSLALPFIWNPVELDYSEAYLNKPEENFKLELDSLYKDATLNVPPRTLSKGKHVIAFMSMSCPHCRIAAKKIRIMHERNPDISFYFVLNGKDEKLKPFFDDTQTESIPHCILNGRNFVYLAGLDMPAIFLVNNSVVEHWVNYIDLDQNEIEKWIGSK